MGLGKSNQLSLGVSLNDEATFDNYYAPISSSAPQVIDVLKQQIEPEGELSIYLWGKPGCGLTHLLQASCQYANEKGTYAQYIPLQDLVGFAPESLFEGLEVQDLICLDGLHTVAGNPLWDEALFVLFNQMRDAGKRLVFGATLNPNELSSSLPDLQSRLNWSVVFHLEELNDADKQAALQHRAKARGMEMTDDVAQYIISHAPRDMNDLFYLLNRLDELSLVEQRKLTIPFVKEVIK
ncbi:MAG: DnaA regulatory inactivator Hda [Cellvibrionaceae bacterium]